MIVLDASGQRQDLRAGMGGPGGPKIYDATGLRRDLRQITVPSGGRLPSLNNPPATPGDYDDEFDGGGLDAAWSWSGTATTPTSGTVDPTASVVTTPVYNVDDQWPSWLLAQSDDASAQTMDLRKTVSLGTDATFFCRMMGAYRGPNAANEMDSYMYLSNNSDTNELVFVGLIHAATAQVQWIFGVENNGVQTSRTGSLTVNLLPASGVYFILYKDDNVYSAFIMGESGTYAPMGASITKTGVTTFDRLGFRFVTANETPSVFWGVDFLRYYPSLTFSLVNP